MTPKLKSQRHVRILWMLVVLEALIVGRLFLVKEPAKAVMGFLIKDGTQYLVAWKAPTKEYQTRAYTTLGDALKFAHGELALFEGRNPLPEHELEHVWVAPRFGNYVMHWKTLKYAFLNQLTFQNEQEADYFLRAFRRGAYAPSMFGHSVLLVPRDSRFN